MIGECKPDRIEISNACQIQKSFYEHGIKLSYNTKTKLFTVLAADYDEKKIMRIFLQSLKSPLEGKMFLFNYEQGCEMQFSLIEILKGYQEIVDADHCRKKSGEVISVQGYLAKTNSKRILFELPLFASIVRKRRDS